MITRPRPAHRRAFVLVLVLGLLAVLVLLVLGLAVIGQVDAQIGATGDFQRQARQNALLALDVAIGNLQRVAGPDDRVTAMAGVGGVPAGAAGGKRRHWCGVWQASGGFLDWLVSGAATGAQPALAVEGDGILLVAAGTVGAEAADSEHIVAGRVPVMLPIGPGGRTVDSGGIAWWVGDEGVKISAYSPPVELAVADRAPLLAGTPAASATLRSALSVHVDRLPAVLSFEQLRLLPAPAAEPLPPSSIRDNFHHVTLTGRWVEVAAVPARLRSGRVNLNTTSAAVWRGLAETFNAVQETPDLSTSRLAALGSFMAGNFAAAGSGRSPSAPFLAVGDFLGSELLAAALAGSGVKPAEFAAGLDGMLAVRSDTFRVRAYGDAVNPVIQATEARAWCEAIVQRMPEPHKQLPGRRFTTVYFRWLGPDDI